MQQFILQVNQQYHSTDENWRNTVHCAKNIYSVSPKDVQFMQWWRRVALLVCDGNRYRTCVDGYDLIVFNNGTFERLASVDVLKRHWTYTNSQTDTECKQSTYQPGSPVSYVTYIANSNNISYKQCN